MIDCDGDVYCASRSHDDKKNDVGIDKHRGVRLLFATFSDTRDAHIVVIKHTYMYGRPLPLNDACTQSLCIPLHDFLPFMRPRRMFAEVNEIDDIETILYYITSIHMEPATEYRYLTSAL